MDPISLYRSVVTSGDRDSYSSEWDKRALRERLEYSQLQLSLKEIENRALRKLIQELRSIPSTRRQLPSLPNEILQVIFNFATEFPGLVHCPWREYRSPSEWRVSSITRQSIPLVCRQWHVNGLRFLYQHIVLETYPQAKKLQKVLDSIPQEERVRRLGWIRGLELLGATHHKVALAYWRMAGKLIMDIPPGNLKSFSINGLHLAPDLKALQMGLSALGTEALNRVREHVEVLQLGSSELPTYTLDILRGFAHPDSQTVKFTKLHTLFFSTESRRGADESTSDILSCLDDNLHQLQSMALAWPRERSTVDSCLDLLRHTRNITHLYISTCTFSDLLCRDFEGLLTALPNLSRLTFLLLFVTDPHRRWESTTGVLHSKLETVTILLESPVGYEVIHMWQPLLAKIRQGELPRLNAIVVKGPYLSGCLDSSWTLAHNIRAKWSDAIKLCGERGIQLVTPQNDAIHLWDERHGIDKEGVIRRRKPGKKISQDEENRNESTSKGPDEDSESDNLMTDTSDDSQWYRYETDSNLFSTPATSRVDDDSDDEPYRYVARPDIGIVDSDLDSSLGSDSDKSEAPL